MMVSATEQRPCGLWVDCSGMKWALVSPTQRLAAHQKALLVFSPCICGKPLKDVRQETAIAISITLTLSREERRSKIKGLKPAGDIVIFRAKNKVAQMGASNGGGRSRQIPDTVNRIKPGSEGGTKPGRNWEEHQAGRSRDGDR